MSTSVFAARRDSMFDKIELEIEWIDRVIGAIPLDPNMVQRWLESKIGVKDEDALRELTRKTLEDIGHSPETSGPDEVREATEIVAAETHMQGFKRTPDGLPYIEARIIKAGIKEAVNILYAKEKWGKTFKGPKAYTAERVFVKPDRIVLGTDADVKRDVFVGHINGPKGPQATLGLHEYLEQPRAKITVLQLKDQRVGGKGEPALTEDQWQSTWTHMELNGLGAMRSQSFGQFNVVRWTHGDLDLSTDEDLFEAALEDMAEQDKIAARIREKEAEAAAV